MSTTDTFEFRVKPLVVDASCDAGKLTVRLADEREIRVPLAWFPRLRDATPEQRRKWELIGGGIGVHWPDVDEDISVAGLLATE